MFSDLNKNITNISYNYLNLSELITFGNGSSIEYIYNAAGQKMTKKVYDTPNNTIKEVDYLDGFQYAGGVLQFFPHAEGYVRATPVGNIAPGSPPTGYAYSYVFNYTDHLGNVRLSYSMDHLTGKLKILEENQYYPFGLRHEVYVSGTKLDFSRNPGDGIEPEPGLSSVLDYVTRMEYQYKYNGKELQDELELGLYDYGWRNYDPAIGRWMNVDPLAEDFYGASPYNYVGNDPVGQADFDGRDFRIDVIRDKVDNITGLKFSSTVYIQGSGASKEKADELNKDFKDNYGSSKKIDGIDICIDINYVYNGTKKSSDLKDDENLLSFSAEDKRSFVSGNTEAIYNSGESNRTIFHESFHFMGLSDRYDDFTADKWRPVKDQTTVPHKDFGNDIMGSNSFILSNIHYQNWIKHAKLRANLGPIKAGPFFQIPESYIESKKVDTNSKGQLQDKKGNWYRPIKK